eukprot:TRINITY_DN52949_c0_g1_i1.p1 TRINITY_DN52949_c0_g1~~TRINITY_DN52949_c0_g1_i1.p1  ORF type:complete len:346 (+),score=66.98 TRINITY_DN52949_c0_g1_i1:71-1039(+)
MVVSDHIEPVHLRNLFLMEEKLLGLLFPLVRESNETSRYVQLALPPYLEIASNGRPTWTKNRVVMEKLVGNQDHVFGLVERLLDFLPPMLEQIKDVDYEAFKKIELIVNKHKMPTEEDFVKHYSSEAFKIFSELCTNDELNMDTTPQISNDFQHCRHFHGFHPSLILSPLKIEALSASPALYLVHDILAEGQAESMLNNRINTDNERNHIFDLKEKKLLMKVSKKLSIFKKQDNIETDPVSFEFAGFGPGTHGTPEYLDSASFMVFMNDVAGAATVFPDIGLRVEPTRGSAIISHNPDKLEAVMLFGHCPVTSGVQWVVRQT